MSSMRGRFILPLWLVMFFFSFQAFANQCRELFSFTPREVDEFPISQIFAGQNSVGFEYAHYKALRDAGLSVDKDWTTLSKKEKSKISQSILKELQSAVPVIVDPQGRVFAVDQHHDMYALLSVLGAKGDPVVPMRILRDFSVENISMTEFKDFAKRNGWIYEKNIEEVVDTPIAIRNLKNSVERSVVGMAFIQISKNEGINLKGKFFAPFVQFLIADFIKENGLLVFSTSYSQKDVDQVVNLITKNKPLRRFIELHLNDDAPKELSKFLED